MHINKNISCNVTECKYHAKTDPYCCLDHINVVKHATNATTVECTDCASFVPENK